MSQATQEFTNEDLQIGSKEIEDFHEVMSRSQPKDTTCISCIPEALRTPLQKAQLKRERAFRVPNQDETILLLHNFSSSLVQQIITETKSEEFKADYPEASITLLNNNLVHILPTPKEKRLKQKEKRLKYAKEHETKKRKRDDSESKEDVPPEVAERNRLWKNLYQKAKRLVLAKQKEEDPDEFKKKIFSEMKELDPDFYAKALVERQKNKEIAIEKGKETKRRKKNHGEPSATQPEGG